jgi:hypothetical protein
MACPSCGGTRREPITPGYWRCTSVVGGPVPGGRLIGTCDREYQEGDGSTASLPMCQCGMFAIGACSECGAFTCGVHGDLREGRFLCRSCKDRLRADAQEAASRASALEAASYPRGRAAGALEATGIPTVEIFAKFWSRHRSRWSGNSKTKTTVCSWKTGWIIGELNWHAPKAWESMASFKDGPRLTALLDLRAKPSSPGARSSDEGLFTDADRYIHGENLVMVSQEPADGTYHLVQLPGHFLGGLSLDAAIRQLTGECA